MSTTVLEALQNAQCNFEIMGRVSMKDNPFFAFAMEQLESAIEALEEGQGTEFVIQEVKK